VDNIALADIIKDIRRKRRNIDEEIIWEVAHDRDEIEDQLDSYEMETAYDFLKKNIPDISTLIKTG
jgi:hypothetical protein